MYIEHFFVKKLIMLLLGAVFVTLAISSVEFASADHLKPGKGIFKSEIEFNTVFSLDEESKYKIHLRVEVRNAENQLVAVTESSHGSYIPHNLTDDAFDRKLGNKEIVTIDGIKYEKARYIGNLDTMQLIGNPSQPKEYFSLWKVDLCGEVPGHGYTCVPVFQTNASQVSVTKDDIVKNSWTILRAID